MTTEHVESEPLSIVGLYHLLRDSLYHWNQAKAFVYSAALAFYTIFSIVPIIVFIVGIAGQVTGARQLEMRLISLLAEQAGAAPADFVGDIVLEGDTAYQTVVATGLGLLFLLWGASAVFHHLQHSLNAMFGLPETFKTLRHGVIDFLLTRLLSAFVVIVLGVAFLLLLASNLFFAALPQTRIEEFFAGFRWTQSLVSYVVAPLVSTLVIGAMYKWLPGGNIRWRDVLPGSLLTVILIAIGNKLIGIYLTLVFQATLYSASGTIILFLLWIYYISLIILFGAKFVALYAERFGHPITPKPRLLLSRAHR